MFEAVRGPGSQSELLTGERPEVDARLIRAVMEAEAAPALGERDVPGAPAPEIVVKARPDVAQGVHHAAPGAPSPEGRSAA